MVCKKRKYPNQKNILILPVVGLLLVLFSELFCQENSLPFNKQELLKIKEIYLQLLDSGMLYFPTSNIPNNEASGIYVDGTWRNWSLPWIEANIILRGLVQGYKAGFDEQGQIKQIIIERIDKILSQRDVVRGLEIRDYQGRSGEVWRHIELQLWPTELVEWDQNKQKYTRRRKLQKDSSHSLDPQLIYNQIISKMTPEQKSRWAYVYMLHTGLICYPIIDFVDAVHTRAKANLSEPEIPGEKLKSYVYAVQQAVQFHFNDNFNMDTPHKNGCYFFAPAIAKFTYEGFVLNNVNNIPLFSEPFPLLTPMKSNLDLIWDGKTTGRWAKTSDIDYYLNPKLYIPFNHQNIFGSVLIKLYKVLDENSALYWPLSEYKNQYKNRAIELTRHFKNYLHPAQAKENTYIWAYNVPYDIYGENPLQEDADHARLDLEFAALAERYLPGSAISKEDLIKFANTVKQVMYNTRTYHVNILIDGSHSAESTKNGDGYMGEEGFMYLTEYDNDLYKYYSETYRRYYFPLPLDFIDENKLAFMKALANFHIFSENPESY